MNSQSTEIKIPQKKSFNNETKKAIIDVDNNIGTKINDDINMVFSDLGI